MSCKPHFKGKQYNSVEEIKQNFKSQIPDLASRLEMLIPEEKDVIKTLFKNPIDEKTNFNEQMYEDASELDNGIDELLESLPIENINLEDIVPTQEYFSFDSYNNNSEESTLPILVEKDGKYYVEDGHHRLVKQIMYGGNISAKVYRENKVLYQDELDVTQDDKSYYRGQIEQPIIDKNGNLVLYTKEDELYKRAGLPSKGVSMTDNLQSAIEYGNGQLEVAQNLVSESYDAEQELNRLSENGYWLIQIPKDISNEIVKEAGEVKVIGDKIIIPNGKYKIEHIVDGVDAKIISQQTQQLYQNELDKIQKAWNKGIEPSQTAIKEEVGINYGKKIYAAQISDLKKKIDKYNNDQVKNHVERSVKVENFVNTHHDYYTYDLFIYPYQINAKKKHDRLEEHGAKQTKLAEIEKLITIQNNGQLSLFKSNINGLQNQTKEGRKEIILDVTDIADEEYLKSNTVVSNALKSILGGLSSLRTFHGINIEIISKSEANDILNETKTSYNGNGSFNIGNNVYLVSSDFNENSNIVQLLGSSIYKSINNTNEFKELKKEFESRYNFSLTESSFQGLITNDLNRKLNNKSLIEKLKAVIDRFLNIFKVNSSNKNIEYINKDTTIKDLANIQTGKMSKEYQSNFYDGLNNQIDNSPSVVLKSGKKVTFTKSDLDTVESIMRKFLKKFNIDVKSLDYISDESGNKLDAVAKADLLNNIIEVVEGKRDISTLPEEAAHIFTGLLKQNSELYEQMKSHPSTQNKIQELRVNKFYSEVYSTEQEFEMEAIGQLIRDEIISKYAESKYGESSSDGFISHILNKLFEWARSFFKMNNESKKFHDEYSPFKKAALFMMDDASQADIFNQMNNKVINGLNLYQASMSNDEVKNIHNAITEYLNSPDVKFENNKYISKATGKTITRVSELIDKYMKTIFGNKTDHKSDKANAQKLKGTYYHAIIRKVMDNLIKGESISKMKMNPNSILSDIKEDLYKQKEFSEIIEKLGIDPLVINSAEYYEILDGAYRIYNSIIEKGNAIKKLTGSNIDTKIFTEFTVFNGKDLAGTLDLLVVYPNGTIAIYDYKTSMEKSYTPEWYKMERYNYQLQQYKNILSDKFGIKEFAETRIVPVYVELNKTNPYGAPYKVEMGGLDVGNKRQDVEHLNMIPVARELSGNISVDKALDKTYSLIDEIAGKLKKNPSNEALKTKYARLIEMTRHLLIFKDATFATNDIKSTIDEYNKRTALDINSPQWLDLSDLNMYSEYADVYNEFLKAKYQEINETLKDKNLTEENITALKGIQLHYADLMSNLNFMEEEINGKVVDLLNHAGLEKSKLHREIINSNMPEEEWKQRMKEIDSSVLDTDLNVPMGKSGFMGKYTKRLSEFNHPIFQRLFQIMGKVSWDKYHKSNNVKKDIETKIDNLKSWASKNGMSLREAYSMLIDEDGNELSLIKKYKSDLFKDFDKAKDNADFKWILKHIRIQEKNGQIVYDDEIQERFNKDRENYIKWLNETYPGQNKLRYREGKLKSFDEKYNITTHTKTALFNKANKKYLKFKESPEYYSDKANFMLKEGNEPLKEFYDTLIKYNNQFAKITGHDIDYTFIPKVQADLLNRIKNNGVGMAFHFNQSIKNSLLMYENDVMKGSYDREGNPIKNIPLFYTENIRMPLSSKRIQQISEEVANSMKFDIMDKNQEFYEIKNAEYLDEVKKQISAEEYKLGKSYQSRDLGRNLLLFADTAFGYEQLKEAESYCITLLNMLKSKQLGKEGLSNSEGGFKKDKFYNEVISKLGINLDDVDTFEKFIDMYFYGRYSGINDSKLTTVKTKDKAGNIISEDKYSSVKAVKGLMQYISTKNLALNIISGFGNSIGVASNLYFLSKESSLLGEKSLTKGMKYLRNNYEKAKAMHEYFMPGAHDETLRSANNLSATKLEKILTSENLFIFMRKPDEAIDWLLMSSMGENFVVANNKIMLKEKAEKLGYKDAKTVNDSFVQDDSGNWSIPNVSKEELVKYRQYIKYNGSKVKGSIPEDDKSLISSNIVVDAMSQFRKWMPALIRTRFKQFENDMYGQYDVGRFRVAFGEFFGEKNILSISKGIGKMLLNTIPFVNLQASKSTSERYYENLVQKGLIDPELMSLDEFIELRTGKLRAFGAELMMYFTFMMLAALAKGLMDDDDKDKMQDLLSQNSYMLLNRGFLELSFFFDLNTVKQLSENPFPVMKFFTNDIRLATSNFFDELGDDIQGVNNKRDKTPYMYYTMNNVTPFNSWVKFFDFWGTYKPK